MKNNEDKGTSNSTNKIKDINENAEKINKININISTKIKSYIRENNEILFCSNNKVVLYNFLTGYIIRTYKIFSTPIINFQLKDNKVSNNNYFALLI